MKPAIFYSLTVVLVSAITVLGQGTSSTSTTPNGYNGTSVSGPSSSDPRVAHQSSDTSALPHTEDPASLLEEDEPSDMTPFYITAPSSGETYIKGSIATIKWINGINEPFKIKVLAGDDPKSMQPTNVTLKADGGRGEHKWTVFNYLSDGTYAYQFIFANKVNNKAVSQDAYSEQFKIVSGSGAATGASSSNSFARSS